MPEPVSLARSLLYSLVACALVGCSSEDPEATQGGAPTAFGTCKVCHADNGQGLPALGPELHHPSTLYFDSLVRNGRPNTTMLAVPITQVSDAGLAEIRSWLSSMPRPTTGQALYLDFCGNCHGPAGDGVGGIAETDALHKPLADLTKVVRMGEGMFPSERYSYMPGWTTAELSDAELSLIATFLQAI